MTFALIPEKHVLTGATKTDIVWEGSATVFQVSMEVTVVKPNVYLAHILIP